jgi:hypothetical protein
MGTSSVVCVGRCGLQTALLLGLAVEVGGVVGSGRVGQDTELCEQSAFARQVCTFFQADGSVRPSLDMRKQEWQCLPTEDERDSRERNSRFSSPLLSDILIVDVAIVLKDEDSSLSVGRYRVYRDNMQ